MKIINKYLLSFALIFSFGFAALPAVPAYASTISEACRENPSALICQEQERSAGDIIGIIVDLLLFGIGALSVVMIIVSGIRYSISMGDAGNITKAKNSLLYAVVGLIVSLLAYAVVHFIVNQLT